MINYYNIAKSLDFYSTKGFQRIEAPWWVSKEVLYITTPEELKGKDYYIPQNGKSLVASGEQSFLYLKAKDRLPKGKYQTVTPCFRNESIGKLNKKAFIKNELIITDDTSHTALQYIIDSALEFFKTIIPEQYHDRLEVKTISEAPLSIDIMYHPIYYGVNTGNEIELGSYGIRRCEMLEWIYGTGCAEPRLSRALGDWD